MSLVNSRILLKKNHNKIQQKKFNKTHRRKFIKIHINFDQLKYPISLRQYAKKLFLQMNAKTFTVGSQKEMKLVNEYIESCGITKNDLAKYDKNDFLKYDENEKFKNISMYLNLSEKSMNDEGEFVGSYQR